MNAFDAAIIGGGPAGCSAAITLAQSGLRVALFEAKTYPHDKLCGEFLSPECTILLDRLGVGEALRASGPIAIENVRFSAPDGATWHASLPGVAWGLSRKTLDATLAKRARAVGVAVHEATTVRAVTGNLRNGFELDMRSAGVAQAAASGKDSVTHARLVIAAHGKRSNLDRALKRRFVDQHQPFVALKSHFAGPALPARIELHGFRGGYCGFSECEGGVANVCLLAHESVFKQAEGIDAFVRWMCAQNTRLADWLSHATQIDTRWISIAQVPFVDKRVVVDDVWMAGDAAGLIAPLAGDGIAMALHGGQLAALHAAAFLLGHLSEVESTRRYEHAWRREFGARMRLGRMLQRLMLRPRWLSFSLRMLAAAPPLGRYLIEHTRDMNMLSKGVHV